MRLRTRAGRALNTLVYGHPAGRQAQKFGDPLPMSRYIARNRPIVEGNILALPVVRRCIGELANLISAAKMVIVQPDGRRTTMLPSWMMDPSALYNLRETNQQAVWSLSLEGEMFFVWNMEGRTPEGLVVPRVRDVSFYSGGQGVVYQSWWDADGQDEHAEYFSHRRLLAAPGTWRGVPPRESGEQLTDSAQHTQKALDSMLLKDAILGVVYAFTGELGAEQREQFLKQLNKTINGPENAGTPLITDGDLKVHRIEPSMEGEKLQALQRDLDARIASQVFFLDPAALDIPTGEASLTYRNTSQLRARNWAQAGLPLAQVIAEAWTDVLRQAGFMSHVEFDATEPLMGSPADRADLASKMATANMHSARAGDGLLYSRKEIRLITGHHGDPPELPVAAADTSLGSMAS